MNPTKLNTEPTIYNQARALAITGELQAGEAGEDEAFRWTFVAVPWDAVRDHFIVEVRDEDSELAGYWHTPRTACPNCEQWQDVNTLDCYNQCRKRGFANN